MITNCFYFLCLFPLFLIFSLQCFTFSYSPTSDASPEYSPNAGSSDGASPDFSPEAYSSAESPEDQSPTSPNENQQGTGGFSPVTTNLNDSTK
jgi:hypothetical protein